MESCVFPYVFPIQSGHGHGYLPTYHGLGATEKALVPPQELREARKREEQYQELLTLGFPSSGGYPKRALDGFMESPSINGGELGVPLFQETFIWVGLVNSLNSLCKA